MTDMNEYNELMNNLENLNQQLSDISNKIKKLDEIWMPLYSKKNDATVKKILSQIDELFEHKLTLRKKIYTIQTELFWITPPIKSNGFMEIRKGIDGRNTNQDDITGDYSICLTKNREVVGEISYRGYHADDLFGDVGYSIYSEFRGNNYSYYALCMFGELLMEKGIENFWISASKDNIASVKTIEKYGGVPIKENEDFCLYIAETNKNDKHLEEKRTK